MSALAWPFVVINSKVCSSASRRQCKKYSLREAVYQRKLKAARKCIYLSHSFLAQLPLLGNACSVYCVVTC